MNATVMFIHSAGPQGSEQGSNNMIAYLKEELMNEYDLTFPNMPTPEDPKYIEWKDQIEKELKVLKGEVILVGHSLGGSVLLKLLSEETYNIKISGLFVVAAPYWGIDKDWQRQDFILQEDFDQHLRQIPQLFLYHSREEEIVPFSHHLAYAEKLPQANRIVLEGSQHLFQNGLPELIKEIRSLII